MGYRPYSLRRGGATAAFRSGLAWQAIAETGRWSSLATLRIYVTEAVAELTRIQCPPKAWAVLQAEALELRCVIE